MKIDKYYNEDKTILNLPDDFTNSLQFVSFPTSLHTIIFGTQYTRNISQIKFPKSLQSIIFGAFFNESLEQVKFPDSLQTLYFGHLRETVFPWMHPINVYIY